MPPADWSSSVRRDRSRRLATGGAARRPRPVAAEVARLEERLLLATHVLGPESLVNTGTAGVQALAGGAGRAVATTAAGTAITVWTSTEAASSRIVAQRTAADGSPLGPEFEVASARRGLAGEATVAAAPDGRFVVAWTGRDGSGSGVLARVFSADGSPATDPFRVNATALGNQSAPSAAWLADGRLVVAWSGAGQGRGQTVLARIFDASGLPSTPEVRVPSTRVGGQREASVAPLPDGGFQVAWSGAGAGDFSGIFTRSFGASANPVGPEGRVNATRVGVDRSPTLSVDADHRLAIAWESLGGPLDRSGSGIVARLLDADGSPLADPFLVNQTTRGHQADPSAAFLADGRLAVAWRGAGPGDAAGVFLREFFGNATPRTTEALVHSNTSGPQANPTVAPQATGGYVVAWSGQVGGPADPPIAPRAASDPSGVALRRFGDALIAMPGNTPGLSGPSGVLWYDASATDPKFMKTITITNRSATETIYPFLEDANSRTALPGDPSPSPTYRGTGMFNPFDPIDHEYRGYIGFSQAGSDYLGLLPGQSITINVPLAFWDALRINFTTDGDVSAGGSDLLGPDPAKPAADQLAQPNPFLFRYANTQQKNVGSTASGSNILTFTRIYNSFQNGMPYADPTKPTRPPEIVAGMTVTGPGLPGSGAKVIGVSDNSVTLDAPATTATGGSAAQTDAVYTFQTPTGTISPTLVYATDALSGPQYPGSIPNGRIMWYHASISEAPLNDAPFQLTEATFRGAYYDPAQNPGSGFQYLIGDSAFAANKFDLINYDVSYVDSMSLPIALEADQVPIPNTTSAAPFGWVGSSQSLENQQALIREFATSVGTYFGTNGYPTYYNPRPNPSIKLPSGQNIFKESPFLGTPSSYPDQAHFPDGSSINLPVYALTSNGVGPYQLILGGGSADPSLAPNQLLLNHTVDSDQALLLRLRDALAAGGTFEVTSSLQPASDLPPGTTITKVLTDPSGTPTGVVELSQETLAPYRGLHVYTFSRPLSDYAATAIMNIWYSWANYYAQYVANTLGVTSPVALSGQVDASQPQLLQLDAGQPDAAKVVPGMAVSRAGAPAGIVLAVSGQTVTLSQTATAGPASFTFTPPALSALAGSADTTWKLLDPFTPDGPAVDFSRTVYSVMASMSTTLTPGDSYPSVRLLANIIGATVSSLPNLNDPIQTFVTNQIKSLLRGVPDFTLPAYADQSLWYPDPTLPSAGQTFNVYNLDPFVWFVHEKLGLSGYGFSIDDDTSDVGANFTSHLFISVGGLGEAGGPTSLPNQNEWTTVAPYGPVSGQGTVATDPGSGLLTRISGLPLTVANQVVGYNAPQNLVGSLVNGPGITPGTTVFSFDGQGNVTLSQPINLPAGSSGTFSFFGPLVARAQVGGPGQAADTLVFQDDAAFATLQLLGPLANLQVTGPGIEPGATVTVLGITPSTRSVKLSRPLQLSSPPGTYSYTVGHATPVSP